MALSVSPPTVFSAGIAGASGYAGSELNRLIAAHPALRVTATGREASMLESCDVALLALPHGASGAVAQELADAGHAGRRPLPRPARDVVLRAHRAAP